jgi:hypothetical protein
MKLGLVSVLGLTISGVLVSACEQAPPRALYTVNYYRTHEDFRRDKLRECQADPALLQSNPDCINATRAESAGTTLATTN